MKKLLLSLIVMIFAAQLSAQSLIFKHEGETVEPGTFNIVSDVDEYYPVLVFDLEVINTTENDINVVLNIVSDEIGYNDFCWSSCFSPEFSVDTALVEAGQSWSFSGHAGFHNGNHELSFPSGTTISMEYTFYDATNPEEKYTFNVNYTYQKEEGESIADFNSVDVFSSAYPNPANSTVSFDYNMPLDVNSASVAIYNMMGQEVVRENLNLGGSRADINVSDLNEGVYFYSLIVNNETVKTNKFVVSR